MDAVAETIQERRNTLIETQEMIAILAVVIVAVFVIVVGFDCIKRRNVRYRSSDS